VKSIKLLGAIALIFAVSMMSSAAFARHPTFGPPATTHPVVYVTSQDLCYTTIVLTGVPRRGPFQLLIPGGPFGADLTTDFGIGDVGYLGGRWWIDDMPANGTMDPGDTYFMCPLTNEVTCPSRL